jgi:hypothetical protein
MLEEAAALQMVTDLPGIALAFKSGTIGQARADAKAALAAGTPRQLAAAASMMALAASALSAIPAMLDDVGLRRGLWEIEGQHLF